MGKDLIGLLIEYNVIMCVEYLIYCLHVVEAPLELPHLILEADHLCLALNSLGIKFENQRIRWILRSLPVSAFSDSKIALL